MLLEKNYNVAYVFFHHRFDHISHKQNLIISITTRSKEAFFPAMKSSRGVPSQFVVKCESVIGVGTYGGSPAEVSGTSECHYHRLYKNRSLPKPYQMFFTT